VGAAPGYGYVIADHPARGKTIVRDEHAAKVIQEIARRLCDCETPTAIVQSLNTRGEPTYRDRIRDLEGRSDRSGSGARERWGRHTIRTMMTNQRLLGYKTSKGKPVAGPDGAPVQIAEPILSLQEFQRVQNALSARSATPARTRRTTPLLGVVKCGRCGRNASRVGNSYKGHRYQYYRCNSDSADTDRCRGSAHEDPVKGIVERAFLSQLADVRVLDRE
jgi:hypothetical protein